jgi:hypothetical protein
VDKDDFDEGEDGVDEDYDESQEMYDFELKLKEGKNKKYQKYG